MARHRYENPPWRYTDADSRKGTRKVIEEATKVKPADAPPKHRADDKSK